MTDKPINRRVQPRRMVEWDAECRLGGSFAGGIIRDVSRGGVFFTPDGLDLELADRHDEGELSFMEKGDTVLLKYLPRSDSVPVTVLATVRWIGKSREHQARGAGLAFERQE